MPRRSHELGGAQAQEADMADEEKKSKKRPRTKSLYSCYLSFLNGYTKHPEEKSVQFADVKRALARDTGDPQVRKLCEDLKLWEGLAERIRLSDEKQKQEELKAEVDALKNSLYVVFRDSAKNQAFESIVAEAGVKFLLM